jgi:hypothetical protein
MIDVTVRLLETLSSPVDSRFLGPMIVREIIYRVLCGEKGMLSVLSHIGISVSFRYHVYLIKYINRTVKRWI